MKKIIYILIALLMAGGGALCYHKFTDRQTVSLSRFLSEDTLLYVNQRKLGVITKRFSGQPLSKALQKIDFVKLALDIDLPLTQVNELREAINFFQSKEFQFLYDELLSLDFSVGLQAYSHANSLSEYLINNLLILSLPKHDPRFVEIFGEIFTDRKNVISTTYGRYLIERTTLGQNIEVSFTKIGSQYLIAFNQRTIRQALDRFDDNSPSLDENFFFKRLRKNYKKSQLFCFAAVDKIINILHSNISPENTNTLNLLNNWQGFTAAAFSGQSSDLISQNSLSVYFNKNKLNRHTSQLLSIHPEANSKMAFIPQDTLLYYWTNTFDMPTMWEIFMNESGIPDETVLGFKKNIEDLSGVSFQKLLALTGNNLHLIMRKYSAADFIPVPNFSILLDIRNLQTTEQIVDSFFVKNKIPHGQEKYRGVDFTYWGEGKQKGLQPTYGFYDDVLMFSSSLQMHKAIIDSFTDDQTIEQTQNFALIGGNLFRDSNSTCFLQLEELLDVVKELVSWGGTMIAIQNRQAAYKSKLIIDRLIHPLLDGMKMYTAVATRSYVRKGELLIETKTLTAE